MNTLPKEPTGHYLREPSTIAKRNELADQRFDAAVRVARAATMANERNELAKLTEEQIVSGHRLPVPEEPPSSEAVPDHFVFGENEPRSISLGDGVWRFVPGQIIDRSVASEIMQMTGLKLIPVYNPRT